MSAFFCSVKIPCRTIWRIEGRSMPNVPLSFGIVTVMCVAVSVRDMFGLSSLCLPACCVPDDHRQRQEHHADRDEGQGRIPLALGLVHGSCSNTTCACRCTYRSALMKAMAPTTSHNATNNVHRVL